MLYTKKSLEDLRQEIVLLDVLSEFLDITIEKNNMEASAPCPFHENKSNKNTFILSGDFYNCAECNAHGDTIAFLMTHAKMGWSQCIEYLAKRYDIKMEKIEFSPSINERILRLEQEINELIILKQKDIEMRESLINHLKYFIKLEKSIPTPQIPTQS